MIGIKRNISLTSPQASLDVPLTISYRDLSLSRDFAIGFVFAIEFRFIYLFIYRRSLVYFHGMYFPHNMVQNAKFITIDVAILTFLTGVARKLPPSWYRSYETDGGRSLSFAFLLLRVTFYILRKRYFSARIIKKCIYEKMYTIADAFHSTKS